MSICSLCYQAMKLFLYFAATFAVVYGAPQGGLDSRIIGGQVVTNPAEFPYLVSISEDSQHICAGFIYNDRWIATAASCVFNKAIPKLAVKVGSVSLITPGPEEQLIPVAVVRIHPSYDDTLLVNDLALLQTARPIVLGDHAKVVRYDEVESLITDNWIAGWGAQYDGGIVSTKLRKAKIANVDNGVANCASYSNYVMNKMICAKSDSADAALAGSPCDFDQGTPLVQRYADATEPSGYYPIVVGVMSKKSSCANPAVEPAIYTRLTAYYSWILQTAGQQPASV